MKGIVNLEISSQKCGMNNLPPQYKALKMNIVNKKKASANNASTPTTAKAHRTKPTQAAVCVDAPVPATRTNTFVLRLAKESSSFRNQ